MVDYSGSCRAVGLINDESTEANRCASVKCENKLSEHCMGIVPPGACCPVCGGVIRIIYSRKQIDRALYALQGKDTESLTLKAILRSLQSLIKTSQCYLSGYLTFETDIFIVVYSIHKNPTHIQVESCKREAEKLSILIETKSHFVTSDLGLSALTVANVIKPIISGSCGAVGSLLSLLIPIVVLVVNR
jgi:reversion-inducing cysteine-rich kazal motif protein